MSFYPGGNTLLMSMRSQMLEGTTSFSLLHRPLVSVHIHTFLSSSHIIISHFHAYLTHLLCSTWCSYWAWSGGCGRNFHCDQLGQTTGSHHRYATTTLLVATRNLSHSVIHFKLCCLFLGGRLSCRLHAISGRWKHGVDPPWHCDIGDPEWPTAWEVVQHQHLCCGGQPWESADLSAGQHRWRPTSR